MKVTKELQEYLEANEQIEAVFFNKKGEWQFHERKGYFNEVSRDEVLSSDTEEVAEETVTQTKPGKVKTAKVAEETADKIQE